MSVLNGFKKYKNYKADANGDHQLQSFWTSSDTVEDADGNTLTEILANLPNPMVFKGTVGAQADNPTITALPVNGSANIGDTYKVITDGIYASVEAKVGDMFTCLTKTNNANTWTHIPAGDESIVIANPSGEATDELEKISIDNTIYNIKDTKAREDITEVDTESTTPFLYRQTPHNADGVFLDSLVGGSVVVNQLFDVTKAYTTDSNITLSVSNGVITINGTTSDAFPIDANASGASTVPILLNHKYFYAIIGNVTVDSVGFNGYGFYLGNKQSNIINNSYGNYANGYGFHFKLQAGSYTNVKIQVVFVDLTQYFGSSTIPDASYTKEKSTAGSGIAWLKSQGHDFSKYIQYNTGTLESVNPSGKRINELNLIGLSETGRQQNGITFIVNGDGSVTANGTSTDRCQIYWTIPNSVGIKFAGKRLTGCPSVSGCQIMLEDEFTPYFGYAIDTGSGAVIDESIVNATGNFTIIIRIVSGVTLNNVKILPAINAHTYTISQSPLRGIPQLVNDAIVYDGDVRHASGKTTRKYVISDLGTLDWYMASEGMFIAEIDKRTGVHALICEGYIYTSGMGFDVPDKCISDSASSTYLSYVFIRDDTYSSAASFKTAVIGKKLQYEKSTPTTEQLAPYQNPQICYKDGTEEWIDDRTVPIPVGHNSRYADLPAIMDGDYLSYMARNFASEEYVDRAIEAEISNLGFSIVNGKLCQTYNI